MRTLTESILVQAPLEAFWEVLNDPFYTPKLYPDVVSIRVDPPGRAAVGQKRTTGVRAGKRLVEIRTKVSELIPLKKFELTGHPGGALDEFSQVIEMEAEGEGTRAVITFYFKISRDYFEHGADPVVLEQLLVTNAQNYIKNLKALAELQKVE